MKFYDEAQSLAYSELDEFRPHTLFYPFNFSTICVDLIRIHLKIKSLLMPK